MPTKSPYTLGPGEIYIDDVVLHADGAEESGIPDFDYTEKVENIHEEARKYIRVSTRDHVVFTATIKTPEFWFYKLSGLYNWVIDYCPNRRVAHLIKYGKTKRIRYKNFHRALRILGKVVN